MSEESTLQRTLQEMGYDDVSIKRGMKVFKRYYPDRRMDQNVIIEIISQLQTRESEKGRRKALTVEKDRPPPDYSCVAWDKLKPGDIVDYQHDLGAFSAEKAEVVSVDGPSKIEISFPLSDSVYDRQYVIVHSRCLDKIEEESPKRTTDDEVMAEEKKEEHSEEKEAKGDEHDSEEDIIGFPCPLTKEELSLLKRGDQVDHRSQMGRYLKDEIQARKGQVLRLRDNYHDLKKESNRFFRSEIVTMRSAHRLTHLQIGDFVAIHPTLRHYGQWIAAEIKIKDHIGGQVQVAYEMSGYKHLYWVHLDDESEIQELSEIRARMDPIKTEDDRDATKLKRSEKKSKKSKERKKKKKDDLFPLLSPDEVISNPYRSGDSLEVLDKKSSLWIRAMVTSSHNNWIVVHSDGYDSKYDQRIHIVRMKDRIRDVSVEHLIEEPETMESKYFRSLRDYQ